VANLNPAEVIVVLFCVIQGFGASAVEGAPEPYKGTKAPIVMRMQPKRGGFGVEIFNSLYTNSVSGIEPLDEISTLFSHFCALIPTALLRAVLPGTLESL